MRIAVTAATGGLGSRVLMELRKEIPSAELMGIARNPEKGSLEGISYRKGDYNRYEEFREALEGVDAVLLISSNDYPDKRIQQHRNVLQSAKDNHVKRFVYSSIIGETEGSEFSPVVASNRTTEEDVKGSGLEWRIGRNGLYIEPDLEYIDSYRKAGKITNCAGAGKCAYTSRAELARAYVRLLTGEGLESDIHNLSGDPVNQDELAKTMNKVFGTQLSYQSVDFAEYLEDRKRALGDLYGTIVGGIYQSIRDGAFDKPSGYEKVMGRPHKSLIEMMEEYKE